MMLHLGQFEGWISSVLIAILMAVRWRNKKTSSCWFFYLVADFIGQSHEI
jgi:uncharacterized membrane protein